jgi:protein-L-isoaspartate(D-aspartate) O-methyltransferase
MRLLDEIERGMALSPAVRRAFERVDRALFVSSYFEHHGTYWVEQADASQVVSHDRPLVTHLDAAGVPDSSSSQPSLMAAMLEALDVQPGMRVFEIGTGTGYNAALLRVLVGTQGQVVSIDIDPELIHQAQAHLDAGGWEDVQLIVGNGFEGYAPGAPYDRIIATGAFRTLPVPWCEQLVLGGILVGNLRGPLASVLIRLVNTPEGMEGWMLPHSALFMELRPGPGLMMKPFDWAPYDAIPGETAFPEVDLATALQNPSFLVYLQGKQPALRLQFRHDGQALSSWLLDTRQRASLSMAVAPPADRRVMNRGALLSRVLEAYQQWHARGKPLLSAYRIRQIDGNLWVHLAGEQWPLVPDS